MSHKDAYRRRRANRPLSLHQAELAPLAQFDQRPHTPPTLSTHSGIGVTLCTRSQSASSSVYSSSNELPDGNTYLVNNPHLQKTHAQQMHKTPKFPAPNFIAPKARPSTANHLSSVTSINSVGLTPFTNNVLAWASTSQVVALASGTRAFGPSVKLPVSELHRYSDDELLSRGFSSSPSNASGSNLRNSADYYTASNTSSFNREVLQNRDLDTYLSPRLNARQHQQHTPPDRSPGMYSVASSSKATTINLKARKTTETQKMEEAKIQRKMLDLEITNKSLVEVNATLEAQLQEERARVELLERKLRRLSGEYSLSNLKEDHENASNDHTLSDNQTTLYPLSPTEESPDCPELDPVFFRVCGLVNKMIQQAENAIQRKPKDKKYDDLSTMEADYFRSYDWEVNHNAKEVDPNSPTEGRFQQNHSSLLHELQGGFHGKFGHFEYGRIKDLLKEILISINNNNNNHHHGNSIGELHSAFNSPTHAHGHGHGFSNIGHFTVPNSRSTTPTPAPIERSTKHFVQKHPYRQKSRSLADVGGLVEELHHLLLKKDTIEEEVAPSSKPSSPKQQQHRLKLHHPAGVIMDTGASMRMSAGHLQRPLEGTSPEQKATSKQVQSPDPQKKHMPADMLIAAISAAKTNMGGHVASNYAMNRR